MLPMNVLRLGSAAIEAADSSDADRLSSPTRMILLDHGWLLATDPDNVGREQEWWPAPVPGAEQTTVLSRVDDVVRGYRGVVALAGRGHA